jgi:hypothetical protein
MNAPPIVGAGREAWFVWRRVRLGDSVRPRRSSDVVVRPSNFTVSYGKRLGFEMNTRIRWLRTEWPTSTTMLEIPIYLLVLGAMSLVSVFSYVDAQRHLHVMEALSVMTGPRVTLMEYRAVTGTWPASNSQAGFSDTMFKGNGSDLYRVNSVQIREGGAIDFKFSRGALKGKVVSIRASDQPSPGLPVKWTCGHALTLPGTTAAADQTTVTYNDLPSPCRDHR